MLSSWKPQVKCWEAELDKLTVMKLMHLREIIVSLLMLHLSGVTKVNVRALHVLV